MRLDDYITIKYNYLSRQKVLNAIKIGIVSVNGDICRKPSKNITTDDKVVLFDDINRTKGYYKLQEIQKKINIIQKNDNILDIGSSAGGFLSYSAKILNNSGFILGIEFSKIFQNQLQLIKNKYNNIELIFSDVFEIEIKKISSLEYFDVILFDLTINPLSIINIVNKFLPLLKKNGKFLLVIKNPNDQEINIIKQYLFNKSIVIIDIFKFKNKEIYFYCIKSYKQL